MHRSTPRWLAGIAAVGISCGSFTVARGQERGSADPAYGPWTGSTDAAPVSRPLLADTYPDLSSFGADDASVEDRVADLAAEVKKLKEAEAKAKATAAGKPSVTVGGRILADWANFSQNASSIAQAGDFQNGTEFRHARFHLKGEAFHIIDYKFQIDFAKSATVRDSAGTGTAGIGQHFFKDMYITVKELPALGNVRVGHFKTPFGLENITSMRYATFMERAMMSEGEIEGRRTGVMAFDHGESERFTWAIGAFTSQIPENPPLFQNDDGGTSVIMRYTLLPWYDEATEGRGLFHVGTSYAYADIAGGSPVRFLELPESHLAEVVIDTGIMEDVANLNAVGAEAALVYGPLSVQSEFLSWWLDRETHANPFFHGAYGYVSYFLTGENRQYSRSLGIFDRVKPLDNFFVVRDCNGQVRAGIGAWEIAYRYSYMDLNSNGANGGRASNHTIGLNWYLNPYARVMWNYVLADTTDHPDARGVGHVDVFQMRCQIDF
ncbi:MAG: OprO/OprP family phosphate-selective porin [Planctomycetota bacterium]|jgi:phosphate-selective porin OprO/OprP